VEKERRETQKAKGDRRDTRQETFMIQTRSRQTVIWPAVVTVTAPVAAATAVAVGSGLHQYGDTPLAQEVPHPTGPIHIDLHEVVCLTSA